jgi:hypothetical protein
MNGVLTLELGSVFSYCTPFIHGIVKIFCEYYPRLNCEAGKPFKSSAKMGGSFPQTCDGVEFVGARSFRRLLKKT